MVLPFLGSLWFPCQCCHLWWFSGFKVATLPWKPSPLTGPGFIFRFIVVDKYFSRDFFFPETATPENGCFLPKKNGCDRVGRQPLNQWLNLWLAQDSWDWGCCVAACGQGSPLRLATVVGWETTLGFSLTFWRYYGSEPYQNPRVKSCVGFLGFSYLYPRDFGATPLGF